MAGNKQALTNKKASGSAARKDLKAGKDDEMARKSRKHVMKGRITKEKPSVKSRAKKGSKAGNSKSDEDSANENEVQGPGIPTATSSALAQIPEEDIKIGTHAQDSRIELWARVNQVDGHYCIGTHFKEGPQRVKATRWNWIAENKWTWADMKLDQVVLDCYSKQLSGPEASLGKEEKRNIVLEFWGVWHDVGKYELSKVKIGTWSIDRRYTICATMRKGNSGCKEGLLLCFPTKNGSYYNRPISMADVELNQAFNEGKLEDSIAHIKTFFQLQQGDQASSVRSSTQGGLQVRPEEQLSQHNKYSRISSLGVGSILTQSTYTVVFATLTEDEPGSKTLIFLPEGELDNPESRI